MPREITDNSGAGTVQDASQALYEEADCLQRREVQSQQYETCERLDTGDTAKTTQTAWTDGGMQGTKQLITTEGDLFSLSYEGHEKIAYDRAGLDTKGYSVQSWTYSTSDGVKVSWSRADDKIEIRHKDGSTESHPTSILAEKGIFLGKDLGIGILNSEIKGSGDWRFMIHKRSGLDLNSDAQDGESYSSALPPLLNIERRMALDNGKLVPKAGGNITVLEYF